MKRPGPGGGQQSDPTIELSDSEVLPISARKVAAAAAAAKKNQDVSLWRGEVVASDDFVPARRQRGVRPWLIVALIGAIGVAGVIYALTRKDDAPSTAPPPPGSASAGSGSAGSAGSAAVTPPPDAATRPDARPKPVDAAPPPDAGVGPDAAPAKPTVKKATTKKKKATSSKKKKKRPSKKRRSR